MSTWLGNPAAPADEQVAVTKSDVTVIPETRALWIGGAGTVNVLPSAPGSVAVSYTVAAGTILPIRVTRVLETGTSATNIVALR